MSFVPVASGFGNLTTKNMAGFSLLEHVADGIDWAEEDMVAMGSQQIGKSDLLKFKIF